MPDAKLKMVLEIIEARGLHTPPGRVISRKERKQFLTTSKLQPPDNLLVALSGKFQTLSTLMDMKDVINIGPAEAGTGRHSGPTEGVRLRDLYEVFVIMNQLLQKTRI